MLYFLRIILLLVLILNISKTERVFYLPFDIPGPQMAMTFPPIGIFIENTFKDEGDGSGSILRHERVHWEQYQQMGLMEFYYSYSMEYLKHGRINNWMESEARRLSK